MSHETKRNLGLVLAFGMMIGFSTQLQAAPVVTTGSLSFWESQVGTWGETTTFGSEYSSISSFTANGTSTPVSVSTAPSTVYQVGSSWATWCCGYTGQVLYNGGTSVNFTLNNAGVVSAFGAFVEPNPYAIEQVTITLANGQTLVQFANGLAGAQFFGWYGPQGAVTGFNISSTADFAVGDVFANTTGVPEIDAASGTGAIGLLLSGLVLAGQRSRRQSA